MDKYCLEPATRLLDQVAEYLYYNGRRQEAFLFCEQAFQIRRLSLPKGHIDIAFSLNTMAELYRTQRRYDEAEPLYEEALKIRMANFGEDNPNTKEIAENLSCCSEEKRQHARTV
jgi:tetratricopeptide (TPR) repeat protein